MKYFVVAFGTADRAEVNSDYGRDEQAVPGHPSLDPGYRD